MRSLMAISEQLSTNYAQYLENHNLIPLQTNINLFSAINMEKVKSSMRKASAECVYRSCIPLLVMGKTYILYAARTYQFNTREQTLAHFESAYHCFRTIVNAMGTLPPHSLNSKWQMKAWRLTTGCCILNLNVLKHYCIFIPNRI